MRYNIFVLTYLFLILYTTTAFSQGESKDFGKELNAICNNIANKLVSKDKKKIAVWDFTDLEGKITPLGKYISENASVYFTNAPGDLSVVDRNHLNTILREHQLNSEKYVDPQTAIQLGRLIQVRAIVTGSITVLSNSINLTMKVIDAQTGDIIAASSNDIPFNDNVKELLGIPASGGSNQSMAGKGFNHPLNSNEGYNNPGTVSEECQQKRTGDYCFYNGSKKRLNINIEATPYGSQRGGGYVMVEPGQTQCMYNLEQGTYTYNFIYEEPAENNFFAAKQHVYGTGQIQIETCKSKTYQIK